MDEVSYALEAKKLVIPILYRECTIPFRLRRLQYIDFRNDYQSGLSHLLKVLLGQPVGHDQPIPIEVKSHPHGQGEEEGHPSRISGATGTSKSMERLLSTRAKRSGLSQLSRALPLWASGASNK
jgi:hypothetical protein